MLRGRAAIVEREFKSLPMPARAKVMKRMRAESVAGSASGEWDGGGPAAWYASAEELLGEAGDYADESVLSVANKLDKFSEAISEQASALVRGGTSHVVKLAGIVLVVVLALQWTGGRDGE
jgi:hypothetical protein